MTTKKKITSAGIKAAIATFCTSRDKLRQLAQDIIVMVVLHAAPSDVDDEANGTGDCTGLLALTREMPKSWAAQVETYVAQFTPIRINTANDVVKFDPKYKQLTDEEKIAAWNIEAIRTTDFWSVVEPEVQKAPLDYAALVKLVHSLGARIGKQLEEGNVAEADQATAKRLSEQLSNMRIVPVKAQADNTDEEEQLVAAA